MVFYYPGGQAGIGWRLCANMEVGRLRIKKLIANFTNFRMGANKTGSFVKIIKLCNRQIKGKQNYCHKKRSFDLVSAG